MKRLLSLISVVFALGVCVAFADDSRFVVYMDVRNGITRHKMESVRCYMEKLDTETGRWAFSGIHEMSGAKYFDGTVTAFFPERPKEGIYRITLTKNRTQKEGGNGGYDERYERECVSVVVPADAESGYRMPTVYIGLKRHKERELNEVTVTATKVKFYHKGDTLVYNADAFLLADGSMLDGLLAQMPGVELKSDGVIYCNGKRVQSLLLNGKDVFNGKFGEMLDNLPAYTVKDIAVYDKQGRISEMMGMQTGDGSYVMDVRLKREYAHGILANADAGYGTKDRYLAKLFALWFSDNVSVSANALANNLSDDQRAGEKDDVWSVERMSRGLFSTKGGGLNYLVKGNEDKWELKGSADVSYTDYNDRGTDETEYFNDGNSTFTYSASSRNTRRLRVKTNHEYLRNISRIGVVKVKPFFTYNRNSIASNSLTASFRDPVDAWNVDSLENIYSPTSSLTSDVINRMQDQTQDKWNSLRFGAEASGYFKLKSSGMKNMLMVQLASDYSSDTENEFDRYAVNFGDNPVPEEISHRYFKDSPNYNLTSRGKVEFTPYFNLWSMRLPLAYEFRYTEEKKDSRAYNLEQLADYSYQQYPLDYRPSDELLGDLLNPQLSYQTLARHYTHSLDFYCDNLSRIYLPRHPGRYLSFILSGGVHLHNQTLDYSHMESENYRRHGFTYDVALHMDFFTNQSNTWQYTMRITAASIEPNLNALASFPTRNPLEIQKGATSLRQTQNYSLNFTSQYKGSGSKTHTLFFNGRYAANPDYMSLDISQTTGVQTLTQANGRFRLSAKLAYDFSMPLRQNSPFTLTGKTSAEFSRQVLNNSQTAGNIQEKLKLNWQRKNLQLSAFANANAAAYVYSFQTNRIKTLDLKYGLEGLIKLPYNWDITTNLTVFTRRGYLSREYNTTDPVWNMHVSKSLLKGSVILAVDAYDILHRISHITNIQNPQYRRVTTTNGVPAYILFHVRYQFHRAPRHH